MSLEPVSMRVVRKLLPYTTAAAVLAVLYVVWVFAARWNQDRRIEEAAKAQRAKADREITESYGGGQLKILNFYAAPGMIHRGEKALLCYGVANAKSLRLDPAVERIWPSTSRCFEVSPGRDTRYTLTAEDAAGRAATASFILQVR